MPKTSFKRDDVKRRYQLERERQNFEDYRCKDWLCGKDAEKFMKLVDIISLKVGGRTKAFEYIGLNGTLQSNLYNKRISVDTAKKILTAFKKHQLEKSHEPN